MGTSHDYPHPSSPAATVKMKANRSRDTGPELRLRRLLHERGLRYRVDQSLKLDQGRVRPDIVFGGRRLAVFVDGCFWHGCPEHRSRPRANAAFWKAKVETNRTRDQRDAQRLAAAGWQVIRIWEHEDPHCAADRIEALVRTPAHPIEITPPEDQDG